MTTTTPSQFTAHPGIPSNPKQPNHKEGYENCVPEVADRPLNLRKKRHYTPYRNDQDNLRDALKGIDGNLVNHVFWVKDQAGNLIYQDKSHSLYLISVSDDMIVLNLNQNPTTSSLLRVILTLNVVPTLSCEFSNCVLMRKNTCVLVISSTVNITSTLASFLGSISSETCVYKCWTHFPHRVLYFFFLNTQYTNHCLTAGKDM